MSNPKFSSLRLFYLTILILAMFGPALWTCKGDKTLAPEATTLDSTLVTPMSYISLPIQYDLASFAEFLNGKISGRFLTHGLKVRDNKDSVYFELAKRGPIEMKIKGQRLYIEFPLHAEGTYFGKFIGIKVTNKQHPLETDFRLLLEAEVSLDKDWRVTPKIDLSKVQWVKDPIVKIGPIKINLQETLDKMIADKKPELEAMLEKQIRDHVSLEKAIQKIWLDLQKPMPIYKKDPKVWFKFGFDQIYGTIRLVEPNQIVCDVLMEAQTAISLDSLRLPRTDSLLPRLKPYPDSVASGFNLSVHASLPFEYANNTLNRLLKGKRVEKMGYAVAIEDIKIYGTNTGIAIKVNVKGDIDGDLYLIGRPRYYIEDGVVRLDSFDYDVNTGSMLINQAAQSLREPLFDYIKPYLEVEVGKLLGKVPGLINHAIEKGKAGETINLNIDTLQVWDRYGIATRSDIQIVLRTKGQANLELQRLKSGKKLRIR